MERVCWGLAAGEPIVRGEACVAKVFSLCAYRNRAWRWVAVASALGLGLAACGQAARPSMEAPPGSEPEPPLSRDIATGLVGSKQVDEALASSLRSLGDPLGGLVISPIAGPQGVEEANIDSCAPMVDAGADSDADGYPAERTTLDLDCELLVVHFGGTLVLEDKDDMDADSGFRSELTLEISLNIENETCRLAPSSTHWTSTRSRAEPGTRCPRAARSRCRWTKNRSWRAKCG